MTVTYALVTEAPHAMENFAVPIGLHEMSQMPTETNGYLGEFRSVPFEIVVGLRMPVFHRGEILLLGDDGREIGTPGREPGKWGVILERHDTLESCLRSHAALKILMDREPVGG